MNNFMSKFKLGTVVFLILTIVGTLAFANFGVGDTKIPWPPTPECHLEKHEAVLTSNGELFQVDLTDDEDALFQVFERRDYQTGTGWYWYPIGFRHLKNGMVVVETQVGERHRFIWIEKVCTL